MDYKIIAVDFDGTLCENDWPNIGRPITAVIDWIKERKREGSKIILWTCREGKKLTEAVNWCWRHDLIFDAVNQNVPEIIESFGMDCRKIYADIYIDDLSFNHRPKDINIPVTMRSVLDDLIAFGYQVKMTEERHGLLNVTIRKDAFNCVAKALLNGSDSEENEQICIDTLLSCKRVLDEKLRLGVLE